MKDIPFYIETAPRALKRILFLFILTISIGYGFGLRYLFLTTEANPISLEENYLGNEYNEDAEIMKFKKTEKSLLTFLHNHLFSLGIIQLLLSLLLYFTKTNKKLKSFLIYEPFLSLLVTFLGIYLLWSGVGFLKYVVFTTGILYHITFVLTLVLLGFKLIKRES